MTTAHPNGTTYVHYPPQQQPSLPLQDTPMYYPDSAYSSTVPPLPSPVLDRRPAEVRHGVLTIRLGSARNLALPERLPVVIEEALKSPQGQNAASVTPSSVLEDRSRKYYSAANPESGNVADDGKSNGRSSTDSSLRSQNRDSVQRKQCWWLSYVVLGFDNNEIMVDALGGDARDPVWMYAAHL